MTYTNTSNKAVMIIGGISTAGVLQTLAVDGVVVGRIRTFDGDTITTSAIVPPGSTYRFTFNAAPCAILD